MRTKKKKKRKNPDFLEGEVTAAWRKFGVADSQLEVCRRTGSPRESHRVQRSMSWSMQCCSSGALTALLQVFPVAPDRCLVLQVSLRPRGVTVRSYYLLNRNSVHCTFFSVPFGQIISFCWYFASGDGCCTTWPNCLSLGAFPHGRSVIAEPETCFTWLQRRSIVTGRVFAVFDR